MKKYTLTTEEIWEAAKAGYTVTIIINGEYYELNTDEREDNKK
jgi:hypothetical protein